MAEEMVLLFVCVSACEWVSVRVHVCVCVCVWDKLRDTRAVFDGGPLCMRVCVRVCVHVYTPKLAQDNNNNPRKILQNEDKGQA